MKMLRLCTLLLASSLLFPALAQAQSALGTVRAFSVVGDVTLRNDTSGAQVPLTPGREFTEGFTVITGPASTVTLVQSNGASIFLEPQTSLTVRDFLQDPYNTSQGTYTNLQADPSTSETRIRLNYGEITGNVKRLRSTSSYNVDLPTGSAGIRGTTYTARVTFSTDPSSGKTLINISFANADGDIIFTYNDETTEIPPANEVSISGELDEDFDPETDDELPEGEFSFDGPNDMPDEKTQEVIQKALNKLGQSEEEQEDQGQDEDEDAGEDETDEDDDTPELDEDPDGAPKGDDDTTLDEFSPSNNES